MTTFAELTDANAPTQTLVIPLSAFKTSYPDRPNGPICVGLRNPSIQDVKEAWEQAAREALRIHRENPIDEQARIEVFNATAIAWLIGVGTCDPNDVHTECAIWRGAPTLVVPRALTPEGARFIYDAIEDFRKYMTPPALEATDDQVLEFALLVLDHPSPSARRMISLLLPDLCELASAPDPIASDEISA